MLQFDAGEEKFLSRNKIVNNDWLSGATPCCTVHRVLLPVGNIVACPF